MITCGVCGHLNDPSAVVCAECGSDLSDSPDFFDEDDFFDDYDWMLPDRISQERQKNKKGDNMAWECPYCGTLNDDDETVCSCCDYDDDINQGWIGENYWRHRVCGEINMEIKKA